MGRARSIGVAAGSLLLFGSPIAPARAVDGEWEFRERSEDAGHAYVVYEAEIEGSSYKAYRIETTLDAPIERSVQAAIQIVVTPSRAPENQRRTLVSSEGGVFVVHSLVQVPFGSDRDVTVRVERLDHPAIGAVELRWRAVDDVGPAPQPGIVRITSSRGSWIFSRSDSGGTRAVYENHTDVGGRLPAWLIRPMLRDDAVSQIETLRESLRDVVARSRRVDVAGAPPAHETENTP